MAISTCGELMDAISSWADQSTSLESHMEDFVRLTTDAFNFGTDEIAALRVREMIEVTSLTPTSGVCTLPADYLQYRRVVSDSAWRRELRYISPGSSDEFYPDRAGGLACDFTIVGNSLQAFPVSDTAVELTYYQKIPQLVDPEDTNWLLTAHPTLYLHGGILQVGLFRRNDDLISRSVAFLTSYVSGMRQTGEMSEFARGGTRIRTAP